jgi:hypothetical protein
MGTYRDDSPSLSHQVKRRRESGCATYGLDDHIDAPSVCQAARQLASLLRRRRKTPVGAGEVAASFARLHYNDCTCSSGLRRKTRKLTDRSAADYCDDLARQEAAALYGGPSCR